jgi:hypothetical protein
MIVNFAAMKKRNSNESTVSESNICALEWIAWAMDAAQEHNATPPSYEPELFRVPAVQQQDNLPSAARKRRGAKNGNLRSVAR